MKPEQKSQLLLGVTRSKAKMIEYNVPEEHHIKIIQDPAKLFPISIGLLGDLAATMNRDNPDPELLSELRRSLLFSAHFFDSYVQSKLNESLDPYLLLVGASSYYLCDLPGSASVLARKVNADFPDLDAYGLENLIFWMLRGDISTYFGGAEGKLGNYIDAVFEALVQFVQNGTGEKEVLNQLRKLRGAVYELGSPRQLLLGDIATALIRKKIQNSCWIALPFYSGLSRDKWQPSIQKKSFIKELWPAQHLLGRADVLKGKSAIVQMPTSAGKTKATELILRSAFLADRVALAIIIAPFRALCHEIKNSLIEAFHNEPTKVDELSDALQTDFEIAELLGHQQILVVTPEKMKPNGKPNPDFGKTVALYLGLRLAPNGSIAIFCGRKSTAASICDKIVDIIERGAPLALPSDFSDTQEVERLRHLHVENLGADAPASQSAAHGIFSHHGNTPHGIRLAVEHAMRNDLVRFVVCTSTLAQGVNLPIRYLIVTSVYQGMERIKVRDFHNLIGRAGRAGMHTEGSILFADPVIYDKRKIRRDKWRWEQVKELLEPSNSEPCISNLLSIFDAIKSDDEKFIITMEALDFAKAYINDPDEVTQYAARIAAQHGNKGFSRDGIERQVAWRISLICAIESFLLSHWDESEDGLSEADVTRLAEGTLAFFLADDQKKEHIRELFQLLAGNISANITDPARRKIYGRTLYGIRDAQAIEGWVQANVDSLLSIDDETEALDLVWPLLTQHINGGVFTKFDKPEVLKEIAHGWISGRPFNDLLKIIRERKCKMIWGTRRREFKVDHVVDVCEGTLAYEGALLVGALCEFVGASDQKEAGELISKLQLFQKRLKYGLPTETAISLYELGFSDRVVSQ
ncbi:DEAD/DEAH box helicase, partial [Escherichia coli]|nr:DEAD/DEAH box helicase [Escherichia coli]EFH6311057.1 DEAD/DEAH box helicase [Escherichia coli]EIH9882069.1 DEAD/DEAH box helicase [Escherichia coli]HAI3031365.1 DEAD/DEAH box helicase [Escherichia coli]HAI3223022.1 DEAD/DEAH box helicase [Escherichia coli]